MRGRPLDQSEALLKRSHQAPPDLSQVLPDHIQIASCGQIPLDPDRSQPDPTRPRQILASPRQFPARRSCDINHAVNVTLVWIPRVETSVSFESTEIMKCSPQVPVEIWTSGSEKGDSCGCLAGLLGKKATPDEKKKENKTCSSLYIRSYPVWISCRFIPFIHLHSSSSFFMPSRLFRCHLCPVLSSFFYLVSSLFNFVHSVSHLSVSLHLFPSRPVPFYCFPYLPHAGREKEGAWP